MHNLLHEMIKSYNAQTMYDRKNAVKEVMQELVLCGLSRAGFFNIAAFYGGTALRIFYGLDRFSEDLDFSLITEDNNFTLTTYFKILEKEVNSFGVNVKIEDKIKTHSTPIRSAFLKGNTKEELLLFFPENQELAKTPANEIIKIKFEVDVMPPSGATFEKKYRLLPIPYEVNLYDEPSLFAGKIHALLGRSWKNRVKGRDLYDYVFYLSQGAKVNLPHLQARLVQSGHISAHEDITIDTLREMLCEKFEAIDYSMAKADVIPFIKDDTNLSLWNSNFFKDITGSLK